LSANFGFVNDDRLCGGVARERNTEILLKNTLFAIPSDEVQEE